jgi:hypothetical protein
MEKKIIDIIKSLLSDSNVQRQWLEKKDELKRHAAVIKKLEMEMPGAWVPLRLACSGFLTQRTSLKNTNCPIFLNDWKVIWDEIKPIKSRKEKMADVFSSWLKSRGNHHYARKFGEYYSSYWVSRNWDLENSLQDLHKLRSLDTAEEVKKWWMEFSGIGVQYGKNIPMDEMDTRFMNYVKIDHRLSTIVDKMGGVELSATEKQDVFRAAANGLSMSAWEIDRFCFNFHKEVITMIPNN